jgi:hypothetical protein
MNSKQHFKDDEGNQLLSHYLLVTDKYGQQKNIPVVDVRDGISYRLLAMGMMKSNGRSKYINYNSYHTSHKQTTNI